MTEMSKVSPEVEKLLRNAFSALNDFAPQRERDAVRDRIRDFLFDDRTEFLQSRRPRDSLWEIANKTQKV